MPEEKVEVSGADGTAEAFVYTPSGGTGPWPGVVLFTDVFGIREANQGMARRQAEQGFVVVLPNLYYRTKKLPILDSEFKFGDPEAMKNLREKIGSLTNDQMTRDGTAYVQYVLSRPDVQKGKVGVVGYCMTGKMALFTAAHIPDLIGAAASFHGGRLVTDDEDSPHLRIAKVKAELYFGHAENDRGMTLENIAELDKALALWGGTYRSELYQGAKHGWTVPGRESYNHEQGERAFDKLIDLFRRNLP